MLKVTDVCVNGKIFSLLRINKNMLNLDNKTLAASFSEIFILP